MQLQIQTQQELQPVDSQHIVTTQQLVSLQQMQSRQAKNYSDVHATTSNLPDSHHAEGCDSETQNCIIRLL